MANRTRVQDFFDLSYATHDWYRWLEPRRDELDPNAHTAHR